MKAAIETIGSRTPGREVDLLERARRGDETALIEVFDAVIYDVYSYAYIETGKVHEAESIADSTGAELAWIISSLADVRERLLVGAARRVELYRRAETRTNALGNVRAGLRHAFLAGSAMVSLVYTGVLALG